MEYKIKEQYLNVLEETLKPIQAKAKKNGLKLEYKIVDEETQQVPEYDYVLGYLETIKVNTQKYLIIEVNADLKKDNWVFLGVIDHLGEQNVIRKALNIEVPEKYFTADLVCEHCNTHRTRKETYLVYNKDTKEFKQVGKNCLEVYTGINIKRVLEYIQALGQITRVTESDYDCCYGLGLYNLGTYDRDKLLAYSYEIIKAFGYVSTKSENAVSTKTRILDIFAYERKEYPFHIACNRKCMKSTLEKINFNPNKEEVNNEVKACLEWLTHQANNDYIRNLKTICQDKSVNKKYVGYVVSLMGAYLRSKMEKQPVKPTEYVGTIGEKLEIDVKSIEVTTSWETQWGTTFVHRITDKKDRVYVWKTSKHVTECNHITGTIKAHTEYKREKQTEITRCKVDN